MDELVWKLKLNTSTIYKEEVKTHLTHTRTHTHTHTLSLSHTHTHSRTHHTHTHTTHTHTTHSRTHTLNTHTRTHTHTHTLSCSHPLRKQNVYIHIFLHYINHSLKVLFHNEANCNRTGTCPQSTLAYFVMPLVQ